MSQWLHRCITVVVFVWKQEGAGSILGMFFFFFFFLSFLCLFFFFLSMYMWKSDKGLVHFLHVVAESRSVFQK